MSRASAGRRTLLKATVAASAAALLPWRSASAHDRHRTIATRLRFFGIDNVHAGTGQVRPDRLILSWCGVTSFAVALRGEVFLLDAWVPRGHASGYSPTSPDQLAALQPRAVLLGHGHYDHAADAAEIAVRSGAVVVGTEEHCDQVQRQAGSAELRTLPVMKADAAPGTTASPGLFEQIGVTAVRHVHSAARAPDLGDPHEPVVLLPTPRTVLDHPPTPADALHTLSHLGDQEGGSLLYQFDANGFRFTWHDTAGPLADDAPEVLDVLGGLARSDLQVGAIQSFNQHTNGLRDVRHYAEALRSRLFVPSHHDDWSVGITSRGDRWEQVLRAEFARIPAGDRPEIRFLRDPVDYVKPELLTFALPR